MPKISKEKTLRQVIRFLDRNYPRSSEELEIEEEKFELRHYGPPSSFSIYKHEVHAIERMIKMLSSTMFDEGAS